MRDVIVVDDDEDILTTLNFIVAEIGVPAFGFTSVTDALTHLIEHPTPHLIITDYLMPEMNGEAFLRQVMAQQPLQHTYLMLAARPLRLFPADVSSFLTEGHVAFLEKPFSLEVIDSLIRSLLR